MIRPVVLIMNRLPQLIIYDRKSIFRVSEIDADFRRTSFTFILILQKFEHKFESKQTIRRHEFNFLLLVK